MKNKILKFSIISIITAINFFTSCKTELHEHTFSDTWTSDSEYHWHVANCGHSNLFSDMVAHTWNEGKITKESTEESDGEKEYTCTVCSKTKIEVIAKLSHKHKYSEEWISDATQHWHACSGCDEKGFLENHDWDDEITNEDRTKTITCKVCGKIYEIPDIQPAPDSESVSEPNKYANDINPTVNTKTSASQDFIFNTDSVGFTTITIRRSEWNKMLSYYDYFYKNENSVIAESYEYTKDGTSWKLNTVGLRLRGNTSRFRPQGKDTKYDECGNKKPNADWSDDYYNYAASCSDDQYRQSHFKVDFEPLDNDDRKMSDCMKGVALKRSDSYFSKEIFCYNLFHQYGIWTAPRASQTKVNINIIEDISGDTVKSDISQCPVTKIDYGVYEMFEEVNKQSLKGRMAKNGNNTASTAWVNNEGDLWKCSGGDLTSRSNTPNNFGCEDILILNTDKPKTHWTTVWFRPNYDLKTNKKNLDKATANFQGFITELNKLASIDKSTQEGENARKEFYNKWFDIDFFIKTYAVNILVGMDDDYWGNANNYYLYFDNGKNGSKKCYFIPFDYDNTLGSSISGDKVCTNPFNWGEGHDRPLLDRLIEVPEFKLKLQHALIQVSSQDNNSPWNKTNCINLWEKWNNQVSPYVSSSVMHSWPDISQTNIEDAGGWKQDTTQKHYLTRDADNIYEQVTNNINYWSKGLVNTITFHMNGAEKIRTEYKENNETKIKYTSVTQEPISKVYDGTALKFEKIIDGVPVRENYEFIGWTKTIDENDRNYITEYSTSYESIDLYAKWRDNSTYSIVMDTFENWKETSPGKWTDIGLNHHLELTAEGHEDGIHINKNLYEPYVRVSVEVTDVETGIRLITLDNVDNCNNQNNDFTHHEEIVYPFVEDNKIYNVKLVFQDRNWGDYHSMDFNIRAKGGIGNFYVDYNRDNDKKPVFNKEALTIQFTDFIVTIPDSIASYCNVNNCKARLFADRPWGETRLVSKTGINWENGRWTLLPENLMQLGFGDDVVPEDFDSDPDAIYAVIRIEYSDPITNFFYYTDIINGQIY